MDYLGKKCPVCSKRFHDNDDIVVCPECGAPYHRACYKSKGACIFSELHAKGETWCDPESDREDDEKIVCSNCGTVNSKKNVMCTRCGKMLYLDGENADLSEQNSEEETASADENQIPFETINGTKFLVFDSMAGVKPDEDFDGVSAGEIAKNVKVNTFYYMSVFKLLKSTGVGKFNFAALLFGGGWFLYRKQYLRGSIITALTALFMILKDFLNYFYVSDIWERVYKSLEEAGKLNYANITTYLTELFKLPFGDIVLALAPYVCSFGLLLIYVISGITANKTYKKFVVKKIKKLKKSKSGEELNQALSETGGVNRAIAFTLLVCEFIVSFAPMWFLS